MSIAARSALACMALLASVSSGRAADPAEGIPPSGILSAPSVSDPHRSHSGRKDSPNIDRKSATSRPARSPAIRQPSPRLTHVPPQSPPYGPGGSPPYGSPPGGSPPYGSPPYGSPPGGTPPYGSPPYGSPPQGVPPYDPGYPPIITSTPPGYPPVYAPPPGGTPIVVTPPQSPPGFAPPPRGGSFRTTTFGSPPPPRGLLDSPDPTWRPYGSPPPSGPGPGGQPPVSWEGFYFGGSFSRSWAHIDRTWEITDHWVAAGTTFGQDSTGFMAAGLLGYNVQIDRMTLGIEASMLATKFSQSVLAPADSTVGSDPITADYKLKSLYMVAGRAGFTIDNFLPYFKGGWAFGEIETFTRDSMPSGALLHDATTKKMQNGPIVGFGVDYQATPNVIVGLAYDYVRLLNANHFVPLVNDNGQALASPTFASSDMNAKFHMLSGRILVRIEPN